MPDDKDQCCELVNTNGNRLSRYIAAFVRRCKRKATFTHANGKRYCTYHMNRIGTANAFKDIK